LAEERVISQLKKKRGKIKNHKVMSRREIAELEAGEGLDEAVEDKEIDAQIIEEDGNAGLKPMKASEAQMFLEQERRSFLVFKNADTGRTNVLHRRSDGNFGLIQT